jgi:hypothetical protein
MGEPANAGRGMALIADGQGIRYRLSRLGLSRLSVPEIGRRPGGAWCVPIIASGPDSGPDAPLQSDLGQSVQDLRQGGGAQVRAQSGVWAAPLIALQRLNSWLAALTLERADGPYVG